MEFRMIRPTDKDILAESARIFQFNKDEIEEYVKRHIRKYEGRHYDEHEIKEAKVDRATLNKFKEAIEEKRKAVKKRCLEPYERFEAEVKEVLSLIEKLIKAIDEQIKGYEERSREEKKEEIESAHAVHITPYENLLPLSKIFNPKWENTTYKLQDIVKEIIGIKEKFEKDIEVIRTLKTEYEGQIKDKYIETLDLTVALAEKERLEEQKKRLEEVEASMTQEAKLQGSKTQELKKARNLRGVSLTQAAIELQSPIEREERKIEVSFRVRATERQLNGLKTFLIGKGIEYEKIGEDLPKAARA
jgi:hypothetical protein